MQLYHSINVSYFDARSLKFISGHTHLAAGMAAAAGRRAVHSGRHVAGALPLLARRAASKKQTPREEPDAVLFAEIQENKKVRWRMIHGIHIEVILAGGYALLLVGVAVVLEYLARHAHHRSEHYRNSGFVYKRKWTCGNVRPGIHLTREQTDFQRKIAHLSRAGP